jgi:flagellar P-ring protein FlgI
MKRPAQLAAPLLILAGIAAGCAPVPAPTPAAQAYIDLGYKKDIPPFLRGTVFERTDLGNIQTYPVSGYSIVVNLHNTGNNDTGIATAVRQALIKRMAYAGFGAQNDPRFTDFQPEQVLADRRVAVVQVIGMLPVGARRGQRFDVIVRAMPNSRTTSLAHGRLYNTELRNRGLEQPASGGTILAYADAGDVFVNPVYALNGPSASYPGVSAADVAASLRNGTVLNAGLVTEDRPIFLELRVPEAKISRAIERRIIARYPPPDNDRAPAAAQDEGLIYLYLPYSFNGDWHHFVEVVNHLYLNESPDFTARKVRELIAAVHIPGAPLNDISYCLEAMGPVAVPMYQSVFTDPDPAVAFAAARAALFCGDDQALRTVMAMALETGHPMQLAAVHALGQLPQSSAIDRQLEPLLSTDQNLVRIEAYKILAAHADRRIISQDLPGGFTLDQVDCGGPPLVFAVRSGQPRLAIFGTATTLAPPVVFSAMQDRLTISSEESGAYVILFYRDPQSREPIQARSGLTLAEVVSRLGGMGPAGEAHFSLNYTETVAILQGLAQAQVVRDAQQTNIAPFVLEEPTEMTEAMVNAALNARPQADPLRAKPTPVADAAMLTAPSQPGGQPPPAFGPSNNAAAPPPAPGGPEPSNSVPSFGN